MQDDLVLHETDGHVGYVALNRPDKPNAICEELRIRAEEVFEEANTDTATGASCRRRAWRSHQ